jgi:hypothetical protein
MGLDKQYRPFAAPGLREVSQSAKPTPSAEFRGMFWVEKGGVGVADQLYVCMKQSDGSYVWVQPVVTP